MFVFRIFIVMSVVFVGFFVFVGCVFGSMVELEEIEFLVDFVMIEDNIGMYEILIFLSFVVVFDNCMFQMFLDWGVEFFVVVVVFMLEMVVYVKDDEIVDIGLYMELNFEVVVVVEFDFIISGQCFMQYNVVIVDFVFEVMIIDFDFCDGELFDVEFK